MTIQLICGGGKMKITNASIRQIIKEEILREAGDDLSNAEFIKGIKTGAADLAGGIPAKLNDDFADALKGLAALAQFDKAKFEKIKGLISDYAGPALEKAKK
jgi:hypothetical protein